ncbi:MAG: CCA tRNA nucleotidyltransferase [Chlamydiae bacterium]|nr:CCA tRNA nucleotidyltransferase [Chlamydiota bacterium]MBI3277607.1 CCA tRNA nucleotidyltransferase [Chlamydiota bacterium]
MDSKKNFAIEIVRILHEHGYEALFAGGCVRDKVMGKIPHDYDIATNALPEDVIKIFPRTVPVGIQFGVVLVLCDTLQFEVATFRREGGYEDGRRPTSVEFTSSREDVLRRDFTVNGLLYDPLLEKTIDYVEGIEDIQKKRIRTIGNPYQRFSEDKLRLLRAIRFASHLDFEIDSETWQALVKLVPEIQVVSPERIRDELVKIFTGDHPGKGLELLDRSGFLKVILPEVEAMKGVEQPPEFHPEGDVYVHTKMLLDQLSGVDKILALGALLHDIGKPPTQTVSDRIRFNNHQNVGAQMSECILKRLRFSNQEIENITSCVQNHMTFKDVKEMREAKLKRFMSRPTFVAELELHRIDCLASHGILENWHFLKEKYEELKKEVPRPQPILTGHDLIQMGYPPGPLFKEILTAVEDACLEKTLRTSDEAKVWVKEKYPLPIF